MNELTWISEARKYLGMRENTNSNDHPKLDAGWLSFGASWLKGQAWCGLFVAHCLRASNRYVVNFWFRANAWNSQKMNKLDSPAYGCIVTFTRSGGGHVGFVVGMDKFGNLMVLGGNQGNAVSIAPFALSRVTGYYWPSFSNGEKSVPSKNRFYLPTLNSSGQVSINEA